MDGSSAPSSGTVLCCVFSSDLFFLFLFFHFSSFRLLSSASFSYSYPSSHLSSLVPLRFLPLSVFSFCYYPYFLVISFSPFYFMFPAMVVFDNFIRVKIALTELDSEVIIIVIAATTSLRLFSFLPSITLFVTFSNLHFEQEFASLNLFFLPLLFLPRVLLP